MKAWVPRHQVGARRRKKMLATVWLAPGGILAWIVVGLIAGWLASAVMGSGTGLIGDLILGLVGAFIGGIIIGSFTTGTYQVVGSIVVAFIGAVILIAIARLIIGGTHRGSSRPAL